MQLLSRAGQKTREKKMAENPGRGLPQQAARAASEEEAAKVSKELDSLMARHQERVAHWEANARHQDAVLAQRRSALQVLSKKFPRSYH